MTMVGNTETAGFARFWNSRTMAVISLLGLIAIVAVYLVSFYSRAVDAVFPLFVLFLAGALALNLPIYLRQKVTAFSFWRRVPDTLPCWAVRGEALLGVLALAHVAWFAIHSGFGVPEIVNGQYVIDDHGRIVRELTENEYFSLRGAALRMTMMIVANMYFLPAVYWFSEREVEAR